MDLDLGDLALQAKKESNSSPGFLGTLELKSRWNPLSDRSICKTSDPADWE